MKTSLIIVNILLLFLAAANAQIFETGNRYITDGDPISIVSADFNGDDIVDIAVAYNQHGGINVYGNNGDAEFELLASIETNQIKNLYAVDIDGDNDIDLYHDCYTDIYIHLNDGDGNFSKPEILEFLFADLVVTHGDFNGDEIIDLAVAYAVLHGDVMISYGNGDGTFQEAVLAHDGQNNKSICAADFNNDTYTDLAFTNGTVIDIKLNDGLGNFPMINYCLILPGMDGRRMITADLDGNDYIDLAMVYYDSNPNGVLVSLNLDDNSMTDPVFINQGWCWHSSVCAADFDMDGDNDLASSCEENGYVTIGINDGDGYFDPEVQQYPLTLAPNTSICTADYDGDGDPDLAACSEDSSFTILINTTSQTSVDEFANMPEFFGVTQNYPNPFNASTLISYELPEQSEITIEIFDLLGRKIETLYNGTKPAGNHQALWSAEDVASGVYFYKIETEHYSESKKMLLIK